MSDKQVILAFVDAPDPDNFVQLIALHKLNPNAEVHTVLTGRPVRFNATKEHKHWQWDAESSHMAQQASAARVKNFLRHFGITVSRVFDGGIAPRTLVPHWIHFAEYYKFLDVDPLCAIRHSELDSQEDLISLILAQPDNSVQIAVGGPMTGLHQVIQRNPDVVAKFKELHTMFATWGTVELMKLGDEPRGAMQFNVACDPQAAYQVLKGLTIPMYLMPTEVTRVKDIGFENAQALFGALPSNAGTKALYALYAIWYDAAVKPRGATEMIYIHDLVAALSLDPEVRNAIYKVVPIEVTGVPHLATQKKEWGNVYMKETTGETNLYAATGLTENGPAKYHETLKRIFA